MTSELVTVVTHKKQDVLGFVLPFIVNFPVLTNFIYKAPVVY